MRIPIAQELDAPRELVAAPTPAPTCRPAGRIRTTRRRPSTASRVRDRVDHLCRADPGDDIVRTFTRQRLTVHASPEKGAFEKCDGHTIVLLSPPRAAESSFGSKR